MTLVRRIITAHVSFATFFICFGLTLTPAFATPLPLTSCPFNVDGAGVPESTSDVVLMQRYVANVRGAPLIARTRAADADAVVSRIQNNQASLDINGDSVFDNMDVTLIGRLLSGHRGSALTAGLSTTGLRANADQIERYVNDNCMVASPELTLTSANSGTAVFSVGFAFKQGDIPGSQFINSNLTNFQASIKNRWPDGSAKFAILSGRAALAANVPTAVRLSATTTAPTGTALTTTNLRSTNITASVGAGTFGTVSWTGTDWDTPFQTWVAGPEMSSWLYRKGVGSDAHLVAWLEVRLFVDGSVEVLPWIENGYVNVAAPSNKNATYSFTLGGTQRFSGAIDLKHHQRVPLLSGSQLSHWLASDPQVTPLHNAAYLQSTELVPSYFARLPTGAPEVSQLPTSFVPLAQGVFNYDNDSMASSGYQEPIGLLPQHDVLHLVASEADRARTFAGVVRGGYSAGRYGIHYRDETTNRPLRFSQHPTRVISDGQGFKDNGSSTTGTRTPIATGGNPPTWDIAHSPSVGYFAYLLTGRYYFMEQVQFAATANYLGNGDNTALRAGSQGLVQTAVNAWQTRSAAWDWRSKIQALAVTPDDDTALRDELIACIEANISHFHSSYVAQSNNPFGFILPGETYNDTTSEVAVWQQDFVTAVFGYAVSLDLPVSASAKTKLRDFFLWKAKSVVQRLDTSAAWWYINAAPYTMKVSAVAVPNYTTGAGPWYANGAAAYAATYTPPPSWLGSTEGTLAFEFQPDYNAGVQSMWGNLQPALAYAVRHAVPGALAARDRMLSARNWPIMAEAFNVKPVWAVKPIQTTPPSSSALPAWLQGKPLNEWFPIPGTLGTNTGLSARNLDSYSGFSLRPSTSEIYVGPVGGHGDGDDNRIVSIRLTDDAPTWTQRTPRSPVVIDGAAYNADGKPASRHIYASTFWVESINRMMLTGAYGVGVNGQNAYPTVDGWNPTTNTWDPAGTYPNMPNGAGIYGAGQDDQGRLWSNGQRVYDPATNTWITPALSGYVAPHVRFPAAYDSLRNRMFYLQFGDSQGYDLQLGIIAWFRDLATGVGTKVTWSAASAAALAQFTADAPIYPDLDYDVTNDQFLFYAAPSSAPSRVYVVKPNSGGTWDMSILALGAGSVTPPAAGNGGLNKRFRYAPALGGFVAQQTGASTLWFLRTSLR